MDHDPANWGNPRTEGPIVAAAPFSANPHPLTHTTNPVVTGTSVLGLKYNGGVILAADNLASYGSLARFRDVERIVPAGPYTAIGVSGDQSDYQYIQKIVENENISESNYDDGHVLGPVQIHEFLSILLYNRRTKMNPLWNSVVVAGFKDGKEYLGFVDLQGTTYQSDSIATGFGAYLAQPLLRKALETHGKSLTKQQAIKVVEDCMRVLFYRDARSLNKIQVASVDVEGVVISEPYALETEWGFAEFIRGYGA